MLGTYPMAGVRLLFEFSWKWNSHNGGCCFQWVFRLQYHEPKGWRFEIRAKRSQTTTSASGTLLDGRLWFHRQNLAATMGNKFMFRAIKSGASHWRQSINAFPCVCVFSVNGRSVAFIKNHMASVGVACCRGFTLSIHSLNRCDGTNYCKIMSCLSWILRQLKYTARSKRR